jgi:hypothetical protein
MPTPTIICEICATVMMEGGIHLGQAFTAVCGEGGREGGKVGETLDMADARRGTPVEPVAPVEPVTPVAPVAFPLE